MTRRNYQRLIFTLQSVMNIAHFCQKTNNNHQTIGKENISSMWKSSICPRQNPFISKEQYVQCTVIIRTNITTHRVAHDVFCLYGTRFNVLHKEKHRKPLRKLWCFCPYDGSVDLRHKIGCLPLFKYLNDLSNLNSIACKFFKDSDNYSKERGTTEVIKLISIGK